MLLEGTFCSHSYHLVGNGWAGRMVKASLTCFNLVVFCALITFGYFCHYIEENN